MKRMSMMMCKRLFLVPFLCVVVQLTGSGCAATRAYIVDRERDVLDIITVTVGVGAGAKARVGPIQAGLIVCQDVVGIRGGTVYEGPLLDSHENGPDAEFYFTFPVLSPKIMPHRGKDAGRIGGAELHMSKRLEEEGRGKSQYAISPWPFIVITGPQGEWDKRSCWQYPYWYQMEVAGGAGVTGRLGFNIGELFDFVLGWIGIDIFEDDAEMRKLRNPPKKKPSSESSAPAKASP